MAYDLYLRYEVTGEIIAIRFDYDWSEAELSIWLDGNYACDCNRELFFLDAGGHFDEDDESDMCGCNRFTALGAQVDNKVFLIDYLGSQDWASELRS